MKSGLKKGSRMLFPPRWLPGYPRASIQFLRWMRLGTHLVSGESRVRGVEAKRRGKAAALRDGGGK
jgi:hypothetical protein